MSKIAEMLIQDEGFRSKPYIDTEGYPTVGIGMRIGPKNSPLSAYTFELPLDAAKVWSQSHAASVADSLRQNPITAKAWAAADDARKDALLNMAYQLGVPGLSKFRKMLAHCEAQRWEEAAREGRESLWYNQTPTRAARVLLVLVTGGYQSYNSLG